MPGASDLISRCELFNRLANVKDLGEAFAVIQGMPTEESKIIHCRDCANYNAGFECLKEGYGIEYDEDYFCGDAVRREDG